MTAAARSRPAANDAAGSQREHYDLQLFVVGNTPNSARALVNIRRLCDTHLGGRYALEVIDISRHPGRAASEQITAAPTLVKKLPLPARRFIGDMSQTELLLRGLALLPRERTP